MSKRHGILVAVLAVVIVFFGCSSRETAGSQNVSEVSTASSVPDLERNGEEKTPKPDVSEVQPEQNTNLNYIEQVVQATAEKLLEPGMSEYDKAKSAFDYIIENTGLTDPVGLDLWRIRGGSDTLPSFVENRSLSVLLYGIGMCEDYAAAFTMLLRGLRLEAEYVPGLTYSAQGTGLVDHAWTIAKIDGVWYHFDPQLEDNISRRNTIRYKYFMRSDATMAGSHRWGQNLIDSRLLTAEQNEDIAEHFLYQPCPEDYPTPSPQSFTPAEMPDVEALKADIAAELAAYEAEHGPLETLELDIMPPVFGLEGFGPPE